MVTNVSIIVSWYYIAHKDNANRSRYSSGMLWPRIWFQVMSNANIRYTSTSNNPLEIFLKNKNENSKSDKDVSINMLPFIWHGGKAMDLSEAIVHWCLIKRVFLRVQLDSDTSVFRWLLRNVLWTLFLRNTSGDRFLSLWICLHKIIWFTLCYGHLRTTVVFY